MKVEKVNDPACVGSSHDYTIIFFLNLHILTFLTLSQSPHYYFNTLSEA